MPMAVIIRIIENPLMILLSNLFVLGLMVYFIYKYASGILRKRKENDVLLAYLRESVLISKQISEWLKGNIKDGVPVSRLYAPELMALVEKDQELYDRIIKLDPKWGNTIIPPFEMHKHLIELAQGKYKQTH